MLTDIGGDPDDQQSLVRLMVYANEFEIEGLIATSAGVPGQLKEPVTRADLIQETVRAYGAVRPKLAQHAAGWPSEAELADRIKSGNPQRGREQIGEGHDTEGSRWLIERGDASTPTRPLHLSIWGGQTDFAQALWRVRKDRGADGLAKFVGNLRVFDNSDQDGLAAWIFGEFPGLVYILAKAPEGAEKRQSMSRGMYLGGDEALTSHEWIETHVLRQGPLGALYPTKTWTKPNPHACMKEGDTPSWLFWLPKSGNDPDHPEKPGWGGQFVKVAPGWYRDKPAENGGDPREAVWRWRPVVQADFAERMRWCVE